MAHVTGVGGCNTSVSTIESVGEVHILDYLVPVACVTGRGCVTGVSTIEWVGEERILGYLFQVVHVTGVGGCVTGVGGCVTGVSTIELVGEERILGYLRGCEPHIRHTFHDSITNDKDDLQAQVCTIDTSMTGRPTPAAPHH